MSLPPGFLDELRDRVSITRVVGAKVSWDQRKSNQGRGDMWAPCPFHQEKTPSFHVEEAKGRYYCFGCHAKGDAITFLRETENLGFMEAVERLAAEAGMVMPARDPQAADRAERRSTLADVMEQAVRFFQLRLRTAEAADARAYLDRRGLDAAALERFEIGFAPRGRDGLRAHLAEKGIEPAQMIAAGLVAEPDDGGAPYDRFRDRITFPIRDPRGRCIAFGGRAMSPDARAKYLNSPQTDLFDKGRTLYNHAPARAAAGKGAPLLVAEGYMDVIALVRAGFEAAVAPLGTAITEDQLRLLWQMAPEPVVALDGDRAGLQAGMRLMDLALPLMEAGQSLRFCLMPADQDPDDVLRAAGPAAMEALIDAAVPMVELLWQRETEGRRFDSPERRAALDASLGRALARIKDPAIRRHTAQALRDRQFQAFRSAPSRQGTRPKTAAVPAPQTRSSLLAYGDAATPERMREAVILAIVLQCPALLHDYDQALADLVLADGIHEALRAAILRAGPVQDLAERVATELGHETLESFLAQSHVALALGVRTAGDPAVAALALEEELTKLASRRGLAQEIREAAEDVSSGRTRHVASRLAAASAARNRADQSMAEDPADYETAQNGMKLERAERAESLALFEKLSKKRRIGKP